MESVRVNSPHAWIGSALDGAGSWTLRGRIPILLGLMMLFDSWDSAVIAFTLPSISADWQLSAIAKTGLAMAGFGGQFVGAILFGALAEKFGRLPVLRLLVIAMSVLGVGCALAADYRQLVAIRLIQGVAIGGALPAAICYVNEIAPTATRGKFFGTFQFLMLAGFGLASLSSGWIVPEFGWRPMFALGAVPLLLVPFLWSIPESPRWLAGKGRVDEAGAALGRLGSAAQSAPADVPRGPVEDVARVPIAELFTRDRRAKSWIATLLWFLTSLVSFGLMTWVPSIFVENFSIPVEKALRFNSIVAISIFILPIILRQTIDRIGRRPPAIAGTAIGGTALLVMLVVPKEAWGMVISMLILGQIAISVGSMLLWPYTAEIYDTRVRAVALGFCSSLARAASMLTQLLIGGVLQLTGSVTPVFVVFGVAALVVAGLWLFATRETAGREMGA